MKGLSCILCIHNQRCIISFILDFFVWASEGHTKPTVNNELILCLETKPIKGSEEKKKKKCFWSTYSN